MAHELVIVLLSVGIPASVFRLWWIWWRSTCVQCGLEHRVCVCPANRETMRPRR